GVSQAVHFLCFSSRRRHTRFSRDWSSDVCSSDLSSAFSLDATFGGIIGTAISWGVKRGIYSNEAGQGTGPHAAAAAHVKHPAQQGLVQAFSVYVDTLFVCAGTAFMILVSDQYNVLEAV